jgi:hypothetical protein
MLGLQTPRVECTPAGDAHPDGEAVLELCAAVGFELDPWQQYVLRKSLLRRDDRWAAFEVGQVLPRQNGKNGTMEARQLGGLFVLGEKLQVHSAHQFDTSLEAFRRLLFWVESFDWLRSQVKRVSKAHGEEGIELKNGQRVRFRTRTKGGGRGFTSDTLYLDEAMILPEVTVGALMPTLSAVPDPQVWYAGSPVDRLIHDDGFVLARLRRRALAGGDPSLAYYEWSVEHDDPDTLDPTLAASPDSWAQANPGLGIRIDPRSIENELRSVDARTFAVERLGIGDWPTEGEEAVVDLDLWDSLVDSRSLIAGPPVFAFDVSPDRSRASIAAAGLRGDKLVHVELAAQDRGTGWLTSWLPERVERHRAATVVCDGAGPASALVPELERRGVKVRTLATAEYAKACGGFVDSVTEARLRHMGQTELRASLRGASTRTLGDAWAWSRKSSGVDITPLVAATLATWVAADVRKPYRGGGFA